VRQGEDDLVNGGEIWTSYAHYADRMVFLVRPDSAVKIQQGSCFLLLDMKSADVSVRPIHHFYSADMLRPVTYENVRAPVPQRIGEENSGWTTAKALLQHERLATSRHAEAPRKLEQLITRARNTFYGQQVLYQQPDVRARIGSLAVRVKALEYATRRGLEMLIRNNKIG